MSKILPVHSAGHRWAIEKAAKEKERLVKRVEELTTDRNRLHCRVTQLSKENAALRVEVQRLTQDRSSAVGGLVSANRQITTLKTKLERARSVRLAKIELPTARYLRPEKSREEVANLIYQVLLMETSPISMSEICKQTGTEINRSRHIVNALIRWGKVTESHRLSDSPTVIGGKRRLKVFSAIPEDVTNG